MYNDIILIFLVTRIRGKWISSFLIDLKKPTREYLFIQSFTIHILTDN